MLMVSLHMYTNTVCLWYVYICTIQHVYSKFTYVQQYSMFMGSLHKYNNTAFYAKFTKVHPTQHVYGKFT